VWKASIGEEGHSVTPIVLESSTKMPPQEKAHFYETEILWGPEKKKQSWPRRVLGLSLMNKDTKILNEIPANQTQQHIKKSINHYQDDFISGMQEWFNIRISISIIQNIHIVKKKSHTITLINAEKASDKIQHPFMNKLGIEGLYLNITKATLQPTLH
jgi:hypothetical protein